MTPLYEDNHLIIVNKAPGELVQGDHTGDQPLSETVKKYLKEKYHKAGNVFLGVVHRLDRPVSGVVVFARTSKALTRMNELIKQRRVDKVYHAIVQDPPTSPQGRLVHSLRKDEKNNKSYVVATGAPHSKEAILDYRLIAQSDRYSLLEVSLLTGRHHQIRVQLSSIGCIIKGDLKYGAKRSNPDGSISLHARSISFTHPVSGKEIRVTAPYPTGDRLWSHFGSSNEHYT